MESREVTIDGVQYVSAPEIDVNTPCIGCVGKYASSPMCRRIPECDSIIWVEKEKAVADYIKAIGADPLAQTHEMETFSPLSPVGGTKHDSGKPPMSLLDTKWLTGVAEVLGFGAKKYAAHNWRKGIAYSRLSDAALRHLMAFNAGEDLDPESGLPHLHHASCCLMFLSNMSATRPELDDRWKDPHEVDTTQ